MAAVRLLPNGTAGGKLPGTRSAVEGSIPRSVVRRVNDVLDLRRDPTHHDLEPLAQGHVGCRTPLAPTTHGDEEASVPDVDDRDLSTVSGDGTVDLPVQEFLNDGTDLSVSPI